MCTFQNLSSDFVVGIRLFYLAPVKNRVKIGGGNYFLSCYGKYFTSMLTAALSLPRIGSTRQDSLAYIESLTDATNDIEHC